MTFSVDNLTERQIAKTIDHSLLRPELDDAFVEDGCRLAARYDVARPESSYSVHDWARTAREEWGRMKR